MPKTIPLNTVEILLSTIYKQCSDAKTDYQKKHSLRDAAVIELLFATGIRISELCSLKMNDINLYDGTILIYGKGSKERKLQIGNDDVIHILEKYKKSPENLIITVKRSVYKAFRAFKYLNSDLSLIHI